MMKIMKKAALLIALFSFLVVGFNVSVFAQDGLVPTASGVELPDPGLTPDSPFYFLKSWKESAQLFFTFGVENKAKQFLHLADVRLAEYQKMVEKGKVEIAEKTLVKYEDQLNRALQKTDEVKAEKAEKLKEAVGENMLKHQEVLEDILEKAPEAAIRGIEKALEASRKGLERATESLIGTVKEKLEEKYEEVNARLRARLEQLKEKLPEQIDKDVDEVEPEGGAGEPDGAESAESSVQSPKPSASSEPVPTEIRYYTCPDGIKVESGKCYGTGERFTCSIVSNPELQCIAMAPPVPNGGVCTTAGETKYHTCSDGAKVTWCMCGPESGVVGAKNTWRCQNLPELSCPKPAVTPTPVSQPVVCYIQKDCFFAENKDDCLKKGGNPSSESSCSVPAPLYNECSPGEKKDYPCPNGTPMPWCACDKTGKWSCAWDEPQISTFCPFSIAGPPVISRAEVRDPPYDPFSKEVALPIAKEIIWSTNETADGFIEYGKTTSYGFTTPLASVAEFRRVTHKATLSGLLPDTTYHFRVIAKDAEGNKTISDDYTFTTGL